MVTKQKRYVLSFIINKGERIMDLNKTIFEINGMNTFVKAKTNAFGINKLLLSFVCYDKNSNKLLNNVDIFMNIPDALLLANDILSGKIYKLAAKEKAKGAQYPEAVWTSPFGGTPEAKAKREDGKAISRYWSIKPGTKKPFILNACQGPGHTTGKGLIAPESGRPEVNIIVPCSTDDLKKLALMIQIEIQSYITALHITTNNSTTNN